MKKLILFGGIGLVVLGGIGAGAFLFLKKRPAEAQVEQAKAAPEQAAAAHEEDEDEAPAAGGHGEGAGGPAVMVYSKIVNLDRKNSYLKVELHVLFRDAELGKAATSDKPTPEASEIRATLLELLSGKTLEEVSDLETREHVRNEIKDKLNEKFAPKPPKPGEKVDPKHKRPKKPIKDVLVVDWGIAS